MTTTGWGIRYLVPYYPTTSWTLSSGVYEVTVRWSRQVPDARVLH